jgi:hypothetical protein
MDHDTGHQPDERPMAPDTVNDCLVGIRGSDIIIGLPVLRPISKSEALRLAAWLVAVADPFGEDFDAVRRAVLST